METLTGFIDDPATETGFARICVPDEGFYHYRGDGRGSLAPGESGLEHLLQRSRLPLSGHHPVVSFETDGTTRLAWNMRWSCNEEDTLAVAGYGTCVVLTEGKPRLVPLLSLGGFQTSFLKGRIHYLLQGAELSSRTAAFLPTGEVAAFEDLVVCQEFQSRLQARRESHEAAQALGDLDHAYLNERGWSSTEESILNRLPPELSGFLRWALLLDLPEEHLQSAWQYAPNRPIVQDLAPGQSQRWAREEVAAKKIAHWLGGSQADGQSFVHRIQASCGEIPSAKLEEVLKSLQ